MGPVSFAAVSWANRMIAIKRLVEDGRGPLTVVGSDAGPVARVLAVAGVRISEGLLIVDEPTAGLDPGERILFRTLLSQFGGQRISRCSGRCCAASGGASAFFGSAEAPQASAQALRPGDRPVPTLVEVEPSRPGHRAQRRRPVGRGGPGTGADVGARGFPPAVEVVRVLPVGQDHVVFA